MSELESSSAFFGGRHVTYSQKIKHRQARTIAMCACVCVCVFAKMQRNCNESWPQQGLPLSKHTNHQDPKHPATEQMKTQASKKGQEMQVKVPNFDD